MILLSCSCRKPNESSKSRIDPNSPQANPSKNQTQRTKLDDETVHGCRDDQKLTAAALSLQWGAATFGNEFLVPLSTQSNANHTAIPSPDPAQTGHNFVRRQTGQQPALLYYNILLNMSMFRQKLNQSVCTVDHYELLSTMPLTKVLQRDGTPTRLMASFALIPWNQHST